METGDLEPERFIYEVRYARAWLMWDRAGVVTQRLQRDFPGLDIADANPGKVSLIVRPNVEISFEQEKALAIVHHPQRNGEDLIGYATALTTGVQEHLEVVAFSRIATRLIFEKKFDGLREATEKLSSFGMLRVPDGRVFNQTRPLRQAEYQYRWEGEATGVRVRFATETEKMEFRPGPNVANELQPVSREKHRLVLDVDYFSTVPVLKEQLRVEDWVKNALHVVHRDTKPFMRERS